MKIAMVGYFGWYGSMAEWNAWAWEANGHEVIRIDRKNIAIPEDCDFVFFIDCSEDYSYQIPDTNKLKIFYSYDAQMPGGPERSTNIARKCDLTFSMNYEYGVKILEKFGIDSIWMPSTYSNSLTDDVGHYYDYALKDLQVCMIGHANSQQRVELWNMLNENYQCYTGKADNSEDYICAMEQCRIVVNQPTEPFDVITGIRFFEALGFRKLCLQKVIRTKELEKLGFRDGVDFVYWEDFKDLKEKLDYYLKHEGEAHRIALNGYSKVQKMSMNAQVAKMEQIILSKFYDRL